jgi:hypothetical protein
MRRLTLNNDSLLMPPPIEIATAALQCAAAEAKTPARRHR